MSSGYRGKLMLSLTKEAVNPGKTRVLHQEVPGLPIVGNLVRLEYNIADNVIIEEKQTGTGSTDCTSLNLDLHTLEKSCELVDLNQGMVDERIDELQSIDINSVQIVFDESVETITTNNLDNKTTDNFSIHKLTLSPLPGASSSLERSITDNDETIFGAQSAVNNKMDEDRDENFDPTDRDYIPETDNYSNSSETESEELDNLIDPAKIHMENEGVIVQTEVMSQNEITLNENTLEVDHGNMYEGRKRGIKRQVDKWVKNKTKRLRMEGKFYMGYSRKDGKVSYNIPKEARKIGQACSSKECVRTKTKHCSEITEEERLKIFKGFWDNMNWDQRKILVINHVKMSDTKRTYTKKEDSRRKNTLQYFLTVDSNKIQICKRMFLQTLCLGEYSVQDWVKKGELGMTSSTECNNRKKKPSSRADKEADKVYLAEFFDKLPKLPSHYARASSSKLYLETTVESLNHLFNLYKETCKNENKSTLSRTVFSSIFYSKNLSLYPVKKDKCDLCTKHEVGQLSDEEWNVHRLKMQRARDEKNKDKEEAKINRRRVLTIDLQAVKVCPFVQASAIFFKLKLCCHNFTVYDTVSHQATCFWFTETEADMTASTFVTCLLKYLETNCQNESGPIIIYSDGCTYQNRNNIMSNALLNYAIINNVEIIQKFLEVGHTQMECDSVHSCIERKLKGKDIHLPSDYLRISKEARSKPAPYEVVCMQYRDFRDFTPKRFHRYNSIRPGKVVSDPVVTDIRALRYLPDEKICYKLAFDDDWKELPQRPKKVLEVVEWPQMYNEKRKIKKQKWQHLQALKSVIPVDCHSFYDNLEHYEV